ncbi:hypothetical protein [Silvanigrella aquatica]|uniref:Secreted protein n=1 Tax=Silvanigrella aquatica TaxID=1915309 RepID=A0A1L4CXR3_9BACT|nr:hypothetical protein [Silvanigrella aquatica]APJ02730.1 hypothetical protein AXG55_01830 [Silvanigrella aquatica]
MSNPQISKVFTGVIVSALLSGGAAFAHNSTSKSNTSEEINTETNTSHNPTDRTNNSSENKAEAIMQDKHSCRVANECGQKMAEEKPVVIDNSREKK